MTAHILIVDDTPENIQVLGAALAEKQYKITITLNGALALKIAETHLPDLILLDVMMPEMNGFQVCEALKANPKTQDIEIIFVTAAVADSDELKGLKLGAIDYIHKPFSVSLIQAKVELHLERARYKKELQLKNLALEKNLKLSTEVAKLRDDIDRITRHDLKTPLNAIFVYSQLMQMDDNLTDEQRYNLEEILRAGNNMLDMVNNSLNLFKMETGCYQYEPELINISLIIKTLIKDLKMCIEQYAVKIDISQQQIDSFTVLGEKNLSYSLFANLIRNAIEACSPNDVIKIRMEYENNYGIISITNPGSVSEAIRDTFFDKYATAGKKFGTGLGTYSAKLMTTTQQGHIAMTTNSQETTIRVALPVSENIITN